MPPLKALKDKALGLPSSFDLPALSFLELVTGLALSRDVELSCWTGSLENWLGNSTV